MKRWLLRLSWYMCLAAGVTVVVAWVIGIFHEQSGWHSEVGDWSPPLGFLNAADEEAMVRRDTRIGAHFAMVWRYRLPVDSKATDLFGTQYLPWWKNIGDESAAFREGRIDSEARWAEALGWPWLAIYQSGWAIGAPPSFAIDRSAVPIHLVLPGFLADTFLYAVLLFCLDLLFANARRFIRAKRGRCPRCGYDLRGALDNGCSECGWNRAEGAA